MPSFRVLGKGSKEGSIISHLEWSTEHPLPVPCSFLPKVFSAKAHCSLPEITDQEFIGERRPLDAAVAPKASVCRGGVKVDQGAALALLPGTISVSF